MHSRFVMVVLAAACLTFSSVSGAVTGSGDSPVGPLDTVGPTVEDMMIASSSSLHVMFNKPMLESTATDPSNYAVSGLAVDSLAPSPNTVTGSGAGPYTLTWTSGKIAGEALTLTVTGSQDSLGNPLNMAANTVALTAGLPIGALPVALALLAAGALVLMARRRKAAAALVILALLATFAVMEAHAIPVPPVVSNVSFVQQPDGAGNTQVVITYDLDAPLDPVFIDVALSKDGGTDGFSHPMWSISGDLDGVETGTGHQIVWAIAQDYPDQLISEARIRVTATYGLRLSIHLIGQGAYEVSDPPPYEQDQEVTIIFHPGTGQLLTGTSPHVPPATESHPNAGWVFSHWSPYPVFAGQFDNPGLEPVVNLVLDGPKTIYATFLNQGSTAHLTAQQEDELMEIARQNYVPWSGMTQAQADALHTKMNHAFEDEKKHYEWWGQVVGAVWYGDFGRTRPDALDKLGEGATWTGMHLSGLAVRHAVTPDCAETLAAINVSLDAIDKLSWVTGTPGRIARFSGPANYNPYLWYYGPAFGSVGAYPAAAPYEDEIWLGFPSRDVHTGVFVGLGAVLEFVQDQATWDKAQMLTERITDRLILDNWQILDGFRTTLNNPHNIQLQYRVAYKANPVKYADLLPNITSFPGIDPRVRDLDHTVYWDTWLPWSRAWIITQLEWDPARKQAYQELIRDSYNNRGRHHLNPYYAAVAAFHDPGGLASDAEAALQGYLLGHPDGPRRYWRSDLATDPRYTERNENHVWEAAPGNHRLHHDFDGMRSPARTNMGENTYGYTHSSWDLNMYYWFGRYSGAIPAPSGQ